MDKKKFIYGTPLIRSLQEYEQVDERSTISKARKSKQFNSSQTVRDEHGRQRFHGAFTGGFSAGYFNTVDSVGGFKPKQFISHRGAKTTSQSFTHKPEDYMDDEDMSEFGIAPKKIRVTQLYEHNKYSSSNSEERLSNMVTSNKINCMNISIGEKILQQINSDLNNEKYLVSDNIQSLKYPQKSDFHGLGYKPLKKSSDISSISLINPLTATLDRGRRLKISGEAFGTGVLEDDDDLVNVNNAYGYDDISNYEFDKKKLKTNDLSRKFKENKLTRGQYLLKGFSESTSLLTLENFDDLLKKYPLPDIPTNWKLPTRIEIQLTQESRPTKVEIDLEFKPRPSTSGVLDKKFTNATDLLKSHDMESKAGLVSFADLKASNSSTLDKEKQEVSIIIDQPTISREKYQWRPCSLLCKHFNVPNPFPDNLFCGLKKEEQFEQNTNLTSNLSDPIKLNRNNDQQINLAPMDLKRSIYDITFHNNILTDTNQISHNLVTSNKKIDDDYEDDYEPQVVEINYINCALGREKIIQEIRDDDHDDIVVVPAVKQEPELIVLSSSSSSRSSSPSSTRNSRANLESCASDFNDSDQDTYGPPLPPTLKTLIDIDQKRHLKYSSTSNERRKNNKR